MGSPWQSLNEQAKQPSSSGEKKPVVKWNEQQPINVQPPPTNSELVNNWDYKNAKLGPRGEELPKGAVGWTPSGQVYFGAGLKGTLKRYWYELSKSETAPTEEDWQSLGDKWKAAFQAPSAFEKAMGDKTDAEGAPIGESIEKVWQAGTADGSIVALPLKASKVILQAGLDLLGEAAIKYEQNTGMAQAQAEFADENGGLPSLRFASGENKNDEWAIRADNIIHSVLPVLNAWDTTRMLLAEGTWTEKVEASQAGRDAGRLLYTQTWQPVVMEEYKRRMAEGDDPYLTALELQNPWAEAGGQFIFDPLNVVGMMSKGGAIAGAVDKANDTVRGSELAAKATDLFSDIPGEVKAAQKFGEFDAEVLKAVDRIESVRLTPDYVSPRAYSPSGMRVRETKLVNTVGEMVTGGVLRNGGTVDDVADFMHYITKAVSSDPATRADAWDALITMSGRYGMGRFMFSDDVLETGILLRNLTDPDTFKALGIARKHNAETLIDVLKSAKGDAKETAKIINDLMEQAVNHQAPLFSELKSAAKAAAEGGTQVSERTKKLAETYRNVPAPTKALWNLNDGKLGKVKSTVNSTLGKFFFSQPGFVSRNAQNNFLTLVIDEGLSGTVRSYFRDGKFWSRGSIETDLKGWFGDIPSGAKGFTLQKSENVTGLVSKANEWFESGSAQRIYWSRFRDTMNDFLKPGVALPTKAEFKAMGWADGTVDQFVHILKYETYGNVEQALLKLDGKGGAAWKAWMRFVSPDEMKGLTEFDLQKEIDAITNIPNASPQTIREAFGKLRKEIETRAASASDAPVGVNSAREGFEWVGDIGRAVEQGHIDPDKASRLAALIEQSEKTADEAARELGRVRDVVQDSEFARQQFGIIEQTFSAERRGSIKRFSKDLVDSAWKFTREKNPTAQRLHAMWNESILAKTGTPPANLTRQTFLDSLWNTTNDALGAGWERYFAEGYDNLSPLIDQLSAQYPVLKSMFAKSKKASDELQLYRTAQWRKGKIFVQAPPRDLGEVAQRYGIATYREEGGATFEELRNTINKYAETNYAIEDLQANWNNPDLMKAVQEALEKQKASVKPVPQAQMSFDEFSSALSSGKIKPSAKADSLKAKDQYDYFIQTEGQKAATSVPETTPGMATATTPPPMVQIAPPTVDGATPIPGQMWQHNRTGLLEALNRAEQGMLSNFGIVDATPKTQGVAKMLKKAGTAGRVNESVAIADKVGKHWRDFALLPYGETRNLDIMASYIYPYQFWYSRTYANWMKRIVQDPQVIANYARLKDAMAEVNKDSPEWWRYNVEIPPHFLGIPINHPMSFNIEANVWPLYGLTGVDFNDPAKRVNWWTSTIDDMGKFGPSMWSPIQYAVAIALRAQGEEEAATRWAGRLIPQTATIKAALTKYTNIDSGKLTNGMLKYNEFDPAVQLFSGGMDPYERNRVGRALAAMVEDKTLTQEQAIEAANSQTGDAWDTAVKRAVTLRAGGQILSYMFGVGMKARTPEDQEIDKFYGDYNYLWNMRNADMISPDAFRDEMDRLRDKFPFMDTVLLSRRAGPQRETAYAYNVLGRLPPGQMNDILGSIGLEMETVQKFYDTKGNMDGWEKSEQMKFMSAMLDLGAMLVIPEYATKQDWNLAKSAYQQMNAQLQADYGEDILDKIQTALQMGRSEMQKYLSEHPEVGEALDAKTGYIAVTPQLNEYYGGLDVIERYYTGQVYDKLEEKYGKEIQDTFNQYYEMQLTDTKAAAKFYKQHPELKAYSADKKSLMSEVNKRIVDFAGNLPEAPEDQFRSDFTPASPQQKGMYGAFSQTGIAPEQLEADLSPAMRTIVQDYWTNDKELSYYAEKQLDYLGQRYNLSGDEVLRRLGLLFRP